MENFKLRAEFLEDVIPLITNTKIVKGFSLERDEEFPDVVLTFTSEWSLDDLRKMIQYSIEDSHVMYQTLDYEVNYTGERNG